METPRLKNLVIKKIIELTNPKNILNTYGHVLNKNQLKQIINHIAVSANSNTLNKILNKYGRTLSPNNYMKIESARRIRRISNSNIQKELKHLNERLYSHTRPNNTNGIRIIKKRKSNLESELIRRKK